MNTAVSDQPDRSRYEITADEQMAGFTEYHRHGDVIAFLHTEIDQTYSGQGLASQLIRHALDDARRQGLWVQPFCPFVRGFIAKHSDYLDLVSDRERERFDLQRS